MSFVLFQWRRKMRGPEAQHTDALTKRQRDRTCCTRGKIPLITKGEFAISQPFGVFGDETGRFPAARPAVFQEA